MELFEAIYTRRSVRTFSHKRVPKNIIKKIIDAAIQAPSACDIQGWKFIVVDDVRTITKLYEGGAASFIKNTKQGVLVLYDNRTENVEYSDHLQSASAAIQNFILAAHGFGIGCCWVCHLPSKYQLRKLFNISRSYDPIAYLVFGYPSKTHKKRPRRYGVEQVLSYNRFNFMENNQKNLRLVIRRNLRKIYYTLPFKKYINPIVDKFFEKKFD